MSDYVTDWHSGLPETPCGAGSKVSRTELIRKFLKKIYKKYDIKSVSDVGCGDQNWIHLVDWDVEYQGYDVMPRDKSVIEHDVVKDTLPETDLVVCICVINHLKVRGDYRKALSKIKKSGSKYLVMNYCGLDEISFKLLEKVKLKETADTTWYYGLWDLGNAA